MSFTPTLRHFTCFNRETGLGILEFHSGFLPTTTARPVLRQAQVSKGVTRSVRWQNGVRFTNIDLKDRYFLLLVSVVPISASVRRAAHEAP